MDRCFPHHSPRQRHSSTAQYSAGWARLRAAACSTALMEYKKYKEAQTHRLAQRKKTMFLSSPLLSLWTPAAALRRFLLNSNKSIQICTKLTQQHKQQLEKADYLRMEL